MVIDFWRMPVVCDWPSAWHHCDIINIMSVEEKWSIDKLDGNNYATWKFQMKHLLLAKHAEGTADIDNATTTQTKAEF